MRCGRRISMSIGAVQVRCLRNGEPDACNLLGIGTYWRSPSFEFMVEVVDRVLRHGTAGEPNWFPMYILIGVPHESTRCPLSRWSECWPLRPSSSLGRLRCDGTRTLTHAPRAASFHKQC